MVRPERKWVIVELVRRLNETASRTGSTHVQKCTFFLQFLFRLPLGYSFVIYHYGPYSFDLEDELAILRWRGLLTVEPDREGYGVHYRLGPAVSDLQAGLPEDEVGAVRLAVDYLGRRPVRTLELLATTYYLYKGLDGKTRTREQAVDAVLALKPHFTEAEVQSALQEIARIEEAVGCEAS